jgi:cytochrome c biogenesis protein
LETDGQFFVGGRTNRAQVAFERELLEIMEAIDEQTAGATVAQEAVSAH